MNTDRQGELTKLAEGIVAENMILGLASRLQPAAIKTLSRNALGIEPMADIADLEPASQAELLFVLRSVRNTLYPPVLEIDDEPLRSRKF